MNQMKFISSNQLEVYLSNISSRQFFSYGKKRVSGSQRNTYIMHPRSKCMPGQANLFVSNSTTNPKEKTDLNMLRIRQIYSFLWNQLEKRYKEYVETLEFDCLDILNTLRLEPYLTNESQRIIIKRMLKCSSLYGNVSCTDGREV